MPAAGSTRSKQLTVLMATAFVDMMGFAIVLPQLPFYAEHLGARPAVVGLLMSAFFLAQLLSAPFWGRLSDRYGRRPMILAGLLMSAVAFVFFGWARSLWYLFVSRLVQGVGSGTTGVVQAYVSDSSDPEDRAKTLGWVTAATSAGVMCGSALSSFAFYLGRSAPGYIAAGLCLVNFVSAWLWLPEPERHERAAGAPRPSLRRSIWEVLRHPGTPVASLIWIYAVGMMAFMAMNSMLALYLGNAFGVTEKTIGFFITYVGGIGLVMRGLLVGPGVRRFGEVGVMRLGALSLALGLAAIPLPGLLPASPWRLPLFALVALFVPVGTALLFPSSTALVSRRSPKGETGQVMGVQQAFGGVSRLVGPIWAGAAFEVSTGFPFWISAGLMLYGTFLTFRLKADRPAPPVALAPQPVDGPAT